MKLETQSLPFFYVVFDNGATVKEPSWDKVIEIPSVKFIVKIATRQVEKTANYNNVHIYFDCEIINKQKEAIGVKLGENILFSVGIFYNSSTWPQAFSYVRYSVLTSDYKVLKFIQHQEIGAADPMDNNKKIIDFISSFRSIESDGNNPAISRIWPSGQIDLK